MKFSDTQVNYGGMFRCCPQSLCEKYEDNDEVENSTEFDCSYCKEKLLLHSGVWYVHWSPAIDSTAKLIP